MFCFKWSLSILLIFFYVEVLSEQSHCDDDSWYLIRSAASEFVLDGNNVKVAIQRFDGYASQLWKFKRGNSPGLYFIFNNSTGKVLDVTPLNVVELKIQNKESLKQQWFVHANGRIVNAEKRLNLDILTGKYAPGNPVGIVTENGNEAQHFIIKEKLSCGN